jgi:hypothetical protein
MKVAHSNLPSFKKLQKPGPPPDPQPPKDDVSWSKVGRGALNGAVVMTIASGAARLTNMAGFTFMRNIGLNEALIGIAAGALIGGWMVRAGMKGSLPEQD